AAFLNIPTLGEPSKRNRRRILVDGAAALRSGVGICLVERRSPPMSKLPLPTAPPLVVAFRDLLEAAGPEALPFLRDWPRELIARPQAARSLPVVSALEGLAR